MLISTIKKRLITILLIISFIFTLCWILPSLSQEATIHIGDLFEYSTSEILEYICHELNCESYELYLYPNYVPEIILSEDMRIESLKFILAVEYESLWLNKDSSTVLYQFTMNNSPELSIKKGRNTTLPTKSLLTARQFFNSILNLPLKNGRLTDPGLAAGNRYLIRGETGSSSITEHAPENCKIAYTMNGITDSRENKLIISWSILPMKSYENGFQGTSKNMLVFEYYESKR